MFWLCVFSDTGWMATITLRQLLDVSGVVHSDTGTKRHSMHLQTLNLVTQIIRERTPMCCRNLRIHAAGQYSDSSLTLT